jgi:Kef-type K+ transport system membrane component KefB
MVFEAILYLAVLIIAAKLFGELMHRINQPTILGNVIAGIVVGPALFAWVKPVDEIDLFISIGVFFLFFLIGLHEIKLPSIFKVLSKRIFAGAAVGFLIPFFISGFFGIALDMDFVASFAIASIIATSSLGVTAKILSDMGKLKSTVGLEIFTITAIVEFIAIIVASVLVQVDSSEQFPEVTEFVWLFAKMIIFFAVAWLLSAYALPPFFRMIDKHLKVQEIYFAIVIGVILLIAYFAEVSGIHGAIGALLLGIALSKMEKREFEQVSKSVSTIGNGIFIPIFFAGIGIHFTTSFVELPILIIVGFLGIIIAGKFFASHIAVKVALLKPVRTVTYGLMAKGAVDLALLLVLLESSIIDDALFSLLVLGTLIMMILSGIGLQRNLRKDLPTTNESN